VIVSTIMTLRPLLSAARTMLNVEYFFDSVCPIVKRLRLIIFRMDHALYPLVKGTLGAWCDTEDAFIKNLCRCLRPGHINEDRFVCSFGDESTHDAWGFDHCLGYYSSLGNTIRGRGNDCANDGSDVHPQLHMEETNDISDAAPYSCVSVHALIRNYAKRMGVETPNLGDLGEEAKVLANLQESTQDDHMDEVLRLFVRTSSGHFMSYPILMRVILGAVLLAFLSAGVLRRVLYWMDLHRRRKYSAAMHLKKKEKVTKEGGRIN